MKSLLFNTLLILLIEYGLGYGIAKNILPKTLTKYALIMGPWVLNTGVILVMVVTSLLGVPGQVTAFIAASILVGLTIKELTSWRLRKHDLVMGVIVLVSIGLNNAPLILRDKFLTTISLGNNDVIAYSTNSDYLVTHSIRHSFQEDVILPIANLLHDGYRWGTPLLQSFFLGLTRFPAWKVTYLLQTILFATMLPLTFVIYQIWSVRRSNLGLIVPILVGFNANLLYMLYHNFYGQVVFWGIELLIVCLVSVYQGDRRNKLEWLIGVSIGAMYMAYHEPALFVLVPLVLTQIINRNWQGMIRIGGVVALVAGLSVLNAVIFDFGQAFKGNPNQPIGWEIFRQVSPVSNPMEMLGLSSVHTARPLPPWLAWGGSLIAAALAGLGAWRSKLRSYSVSLMIFFVVMLYWAAEGKTGNWFVFNRALTYVLPILITVVVVGVSQIRERILRYLLAGLILGLVLLHGSKLSWRFVNAHLSVHAWYPTLTEIRKSQIREPIYTTGMINPNISLWDQIWMGYFLYPQVKDDSIPQKPFQEDNLVLLNKTTTWVRYPSYAMREVQWENSYYVLGKICVSEECLLELGRGMSEIVFGESPHEDSLITTGWSNPELGGRWIEGTMGEVMLLNQIGPKGKLIIETRALLPDTTMTVWINDRIIGETAVGLDWQVNEFTTAIGLGIHRVKLVTNQSSSPAQEIGGGDKRDLSIRVRKMGLSE